MFLNKKGKLAKKKSNRKKYGKTVQLNTFKKFSLIRPTEPGVMPINAPDHEKHEDEVHDEDMFDDQDD